MPNIKLTDQAGLDIDVTPAAESALLRYVKQIPSLKLDSLDLKKVQGLSLDDPVVKSLKSGAAFDQPVTLGDSGLDLSIGVAAHASLQFGASPRDIVPDLVEPGGTFVRFGIQASASADLGGKEGKLSFGASPSASLDLDSYTRFDQAAGVSLLDAVRGAVGGFRVAARCADLESLAAGQVVSARVKGSLQISGSANLLAVTNPLASVSLPAPLPSPSVSAGGSITAGVSVEISAEYRVAAQKLTSGAIRLGWYKEADTEVTVSVKAKEGISASVAGQDLFVTILQRISADAQADADELKKAGVSAEQIPAIQSAVKAAVSRKVELSVSAAFTAATSHSAAFLYEIAPGALNADSRAAIDAALRGNLSAMEAGGLAGVTPKRSVWDDVRSRKLDLRVNLLGIWNARSVSSLALEGKVMFEPATGSLVISDSVTADRIRSTQVNFGADTEKLRHVLAESFLLTAAYQGTTAAIGAPALSCCHSFFELLNSASGSDVEKYLRVGVGLGLLTAAEVVAPAVAGGFGRTLFTASAEFDAAAASLLFVDSSGAPLDRALYERAGRSAIQLIVREKDFDAVRLKPAQDDDLWRKMSDLAQPNFAGLFPGIAPSLLGAITADYTTIQWWASAMRGTGEALAAMHQWRKQNPNGTAKDPQFEKLRAGLAKHLADVARTTREEFGKPWGLLAMAQIAGERAGSQFAITSPKFAMSRQRALLASASG